MRRAKRYKFVPFDRFMRARVRLLVKCVRSNNTLIKRALRYD
jgi:hypothetical protein